MSDTHTYRFGLIGYPVVQSLSPSLHQAALQHLGMSGSYRLYPVPPLPKGKEKLTDLLSEFKAGKIDGLNVTIPHKQNVIPLLDQISDRTQAIGAVNTISRIDKQLIGDNTDSPGFLEDLKRFFRMHSLEFKTKQALMLGAGGSARAVCYGLKQDGWQVTVASRRIGQAEKLVSELSAKVAITLNSQSLSQFTPDLIVNTTPVGMSPETNASPWPTELPLPERAVVYDLVYNPNKTLFMQQAQAAGLPASNGLGMLIEQARLAFKIWTGQTISHDVMQSSIMTKPTKELL